MQNTIVFCLALFLFFSLSNASEERFLKKSGDGDYYTPYYEEDYSDEKSDSSGKGKYGDDKSNEDKYDDKSGSGKYDDMSDEDTKKDDTKNVVVTYNTGKNEDVKKDDDNKYAVVKNDDNKNTVVKTTAVKTSGVKKDDDKYEDNKNVVVSYGDDKNGETKNDENKFEETKNDDKNVVVTYGDDKNEDTYEEEYGSSNNYGGYGSSTPSYKEDYETNNNKDHNYGGYGSYTPSYEEEYESNTYYGGYGSSSSGESYSQESQNYETKSYGYGGNPSYDNAMNETYTQQYEEGYTHNQESETTTTTKSFVPTSLLTGFVVDIHFLAGNSRFQYIAYHYCSDLYPGYTQCDIYNGTASNSKLVATEIVVSADIFEQLPMQERKLWHSHAFAVKSGLLVSPSTPDDQDLDVMASVVNSYGKITDFYHSYQSFPYGGAKLAYGLAEESQINETIAAQLDKELGLKTTWKERAQKRKDLKVNVIEGADDYLKSGKFPQYVTQWFPVVTEPEESAEVVVKGDEKSEEKSSS